MVAARKKKGEPLKPTSFRFTPEEARLLGAVAASMGLGKKQAVIVGLRDLARKQGVR